MMRVPKASAVVLAATIAVAAFAVSPAAAAKPPTLKATLLEFKIKPKPKTTTAGKVKVVAKNIGAEKHELVVVKAADAAALPAKADGSVNEAAIAETDKFGEIGEFKPKKTRQKTFNLDPGTYVLFCNVVDDESDGSTLSHFKEGMYTTLVVG